MNMSNILVLMGSPRKNGNTDLLTQSFVKGAQKNNNVDVVCVTDYKINPCVGCNMCAEKQNRPCVQRDDMHIDLIDFLFVCDIIYTR